MADQYEMTANFVHRCFFDVNQRDSSSVYATFVSNIDLISGLVRPKGNKWGHCDYLLHLLLVGIMPIVVSQGAPAVLDAIKKLDKESPLQESGGKTREELLKDALALAVKQYRPNKKKAEDAYNTFREKARNPRTTWDLTTDDKQLNNCRCWAAKCESVVADRWEAVIGELKIWADLMGVPYDENKWQEQKNYARKQEEPVPEKIESENKSLIITEADIANLRQKIRRGRPRKTDVISSLPSGVDVSKLKPAPKKDKEERPETITTADGKILWSIPKLEKELNINYFPAKKAYYIKNHPATKGIIERWFEKQGKALYFKSEHFDKLKELMFPPKKEKPVKAQKMVGQNDSALTPVKKKDKAQRSDIIQTIDGKILWAVSKLEKEFGISNFPMKKMNYIKKHPLDKKTIEKWFERRGNALYFNSDYFDRLKELMFPDKESNDSKTVSKQPVKKPEATTEEKKDNQIENRLMSMDELARTLRCANAQALRNKIFRCIKVCPDYDATVKGWFKESNKSPFGDFKSAHYKELVEFFDLCRKRKAKKSKDVSQKGIAPQAENPDTQIQDNQDNKMLFGVLAQHFGYQSREAFRRAIETCLDRAQKDEQDKVMSWFERKGKSAFGKFNPDHVEELKNFLDLYLKKKGKNVATPKADNSVVPIVESEPVNEESDKIVDVRPVEEVSTDSKPEPVYTQRVEETQQPEPAGSLANNQTNANAASFGMADVKAVVAYLDKLLGIIEQATVDKDTAEIKYKEAKADFDRLNARLEELRDQFYGIQGAVVDLEKAETRLATVLEQYTSKKIEH